MFEVGLNPSSVPHLPKIAAVPAALCIPVYIQQTFHLKQSGDQARWRCRQGAFC
jgi:hypothetical protein